MSTQVKLRRGSSADLSTFTPVEAEPGYDITNKRLIVGDSTRVGGIPHVNYYDAQNQAFTYAAASGTDTITLSLSEAPVAYVAGQSFKFKAANTNTGSATLNVNSLGAKNIKKMGDSGKENVEAGDIVSGGIYTVDYDGTEFIVSGGITAAPSGWVLQSVASVAGASEMQFTISTDGTYQSFRIVIDHLNPSTSGVNLQLQVQSGGSWQTSNYDFSRMDIADSTVAVTSLETNGAFFVAEDLDNTSNVAVSGDISLHTPSTAARYKNILWDVLYTSTSTTKNPVRASGGGLWSGGTLAISGLRLKMSSGTFTGVARLYGLTTA